MSREVWWWYLLALVISGHKVGSEDVTNFFQCISGLLVASKYWHDWQRELQTAWGHRLGWGVAAEAAACAGVCRLEKGACKETELHPYKATSRSSWPSLAFEFFISFTLIPPLTVLYGRIEVFSLSGSAIFLWSILIPIKTSGGSFLVVRCNSSTQRAEGTVGPGSHEDMTEAVLEHTRGSQGWAAHQLLAANGRNYLIAGEVLGSELIHTNLGLYEEVCECGNSVIIIPEGVTSSLPGSDRV